MIRLFPRRGEKIQQTLRRFRKLVEKEGVIKEMKQRARYETPSEVRSRLNQKRKRDIAKALKEGSNINNKNKLFERENS